MALIELSCFHCNNVLKFSDRISLREECPHCRNDVHVCKNCAFYDAKVYNECKENQAEVVKEKERSNRCEYFSPRGGLSAGPGLDKAAQLRAAAEALFKKK